MTSRSSPTPSTSISTATIAQARLNKVSQHMSSSSSTLDGNAHSPSWFSHSQLDLLHSPLDEWWCYTVFHSTPLAPADPIFALTAGYQSDQFPQKVNLGVGAYRDDQGKPFVLPTVRKVSLTLSISTILETREKNAKPPSLLSITS